MISLRHGLICALLLGLSGTPQLVAAPVLHEESDDERKGDGFADLSDVRELYRNALAVDGTPAQLFEDVDQRIEESGDVHDRWLAAELAWRHGELKRAADLLEELCADDAAPSIAHLRRAELLDASGRNKEALEAYRVALVADHEGLDAALLRLRIALLETELGVGPLEFDGPPTAEELAELFPDATETPTPAQIVELLAERVQSADESEPSALALYARESGDAELCRRSSIVLAFLGRPAEAADLYVAVGEDTARFRQEVRLAEWALAGDDALAARDHAWRAVREANLRRDRRYALGVLVEAHRADETLAELLQLFAETPDLDLQSREVWIDLLREMGETDEALRLFREAPADSFTTEMRRELLDLCRESGREEVLVDAYRGLLVSEPEVLEWRDGYARHELERGRRDEAAALWTSWIPVAPADLLLPAAERMGTLGLDREATLAAERAIELHGAASPMAEASYGFLFRLHLDRGRPEEAEAALARHDENAPADAPGRLILAESYERLGDTRRAVEVMEGVREARGTERTGEDLEMRLAWLYSEVGEEELALERWRELWPRVKSVPRRRYVEDRMMTVAARLGVLAEIAIELEEKLMAGTASDRDSGLLVRLYTRVGDAVSASEIIDEFMRHSGGDVQEATAEKARVYLACRDYYNYEETVHELIGIDPENESDYLRQLAMSQLERGAYDEAREALEKLKVIDGASDGAEFEAGVLALAGMREDAEAAYRKGIARHPERIDVYLLLANVLKDLGQTELAIGMFQHLAATAEADDLFMIAIDGLLNMESPPATLRWARRVTLERLTYRHDKPYLYQLLADLSEELDDVDGRLRALEGQLAIVGERRGSTLRELMDLAATARRREAHLGYGRRLLALGDLVPPQVYLDLGQAFLTNGEVTNASRTFSLATDLPDYGAFQRQVATKFEEARYLDHALRVNERALLGAPTDVALMMKVGGLHERLGHVDRSVELYDRCVQILLARRPLKDGKAEDQDGPEEPRNWWSGNRNIDDYDQHFAAASLGLLATADDEQLLGKTWDRETRLLREDLERLDESVANVPLDAHPRVRDRAKFLRRVALAANELERAQELDLDLLSRYTSDEQILATTIEKRIEWGYLADARKLLEAADRPAEEKSAFDGAFGTGETRGPLSPAAARRGVLSRIARGEQDSLRHLLQSVDLSTTDEKDLEALPLLHGAAVYLGESELVLAFGRQWMVLTLATTQGWQASNEIQAMLARSRRALDADQRRSLVRQLIDRVVDKPEDAKSILRILPQLGGWVDGPVLDAETALKMIEAESSSQFYGVMPLFALVADDDLPGCVRTLWPKVAESQRAWFMLQLVSELKRPLSADFQDFLVSAFKEALADSDMVDFMGYQLSSLAESQNGNPDLVVRMVKVTLDVNEADAKLRVAYARALQRAGRDEEGLAFALEVFEELVDGALDDWEVRNSITKLPEPYLPEHAEDFLAACDRALEAGGTAERILPRRFDLLGALEDDERQFNELRDAVRDHPDVDDLRNRLVREYARRGMRMDVVRSRADALQDEPDDDDARKRLRAAWRELQNPAQELAVLREAEEEEADEDDTEEVSREEDRNVAPTAEALVRAHESGDHAQAQELLHALWRGLGGRSRNLGGGMVVMIGSSGVLRSSFGGGSLGVNWPELDAEDEAPEEPDPQLAKGGLIAWKFRAEQDLADAAEAEQSEDEEDRDARNAWVVLAGEGYARSEMDMARRTLSPHQFDSATAFVRGLSRARELDVGAAAAVNELLQRTADGEAGRLDHAMLLTLFEDQPDAVSAEARAFLDELTTTLNPLDGAQLRRLARVALAVEDRDRARRLYLWCANLASTDVWGSAGNGRIDARSLIVELRDNLEGDDLTEVVSAVLVSSEPAFDPYGWSRGSYDSLVVSTWSDVLPPTEALEYAQEAVDMSMRTEFGVQRNLARMTALLYARAGQVGHSMEVLEYALCQFELEQVNFEGPNAQWLSHTLTPGRLTRTDLHALFVDPETWVDALPDAETARGAWMVAAATQLLAWDAAGRLADGSQRTLFSLLAVEVDALGELDLARSLLDRAQALAGGESSALAWAIDVSRELGDHVRADALEAELLEDGRLNLSRWPAALRRIEAARGRDVALDLASRLARDARPQELLELLVEWTDGDQRGEWERALTEREAAALELEAIAEAERLEREAQNGHGHR